MLRHPDYTRTRLKQLGERIQALIYPRTKIIEDIQVSQAVGRVPLAEAQKLELRAAKIGEQFGPVWSTFWFKCRVKVPHEWETERVDLLWNSFSEATLWKDGRSIQGLNHEPVNPAERGTRTDAVLINKARGGETIEVWIEMACNRLFGNPSARAYKSISHFVLDQCEIAMFDPKAWELYYDFNVLQELEADAAKGLDATWAGELLAELNQFANTFDPENRDTWLRAQKFLKALYSRKNATATHELTAIGHAHIDTAWLWPLAETHRKCERTFSTATAYMEEYPEYKFSCSQAYQYAIIKERNPDLYERIKIKVKRGQFVPVGGTWIEPDCNIPSGEALARQFLLGQRYFKKEFGITCKEFWNPDVFGYNGQLPQIMRLSGITRFLTQKLSWNRFNKPQHHTFMWQGINGSEVLAHFPPADTYNAIATVAQLRENARNYKDHDRSRHSIMLFGFGDGGGGPTKRMLETLRRARDLQGLPRTQVRSSDEFFKLLEEDCIDRPVMVGELYFEYHRGTYTTQASTKKNNRKCEFLLHDLEFLSTCVNKLHGWPYPADDLDKAWKLLLLNQFHDILPGSSITEVYEDAERDYAALRGIGERLRDKALSVLAQGAGKESKRADDMTAVNTTGFERSEVTALPNGVLAFVEAPSYGIGKVVQAPDSVTARDTGNSTVLENNFLKAEISEDGTVLSLIEKKSGRESLAGPANVFQIYDDHPTAYDAWDVDPFHLETQKDCEPAKFSGISSDSPLRAEVSFTRKIGNASSMKQTVRLDAHARRLEFHTEIDWQESHKMLKVAFPVNVRAMNATYEMQFGYVERPTHYNTSFDLARYEVPGHKWADMSEHGFGVALLSESKYGYSTYGNTMRMSLLRAPKIPDPKADIGKHSFVYALMPHAGGWREAGVVAEAFRFNVPLLLSNAVPPAQPLSLFGVNDANLVLDTVKKAEDSEAVVVRLYETHGARGMARLKCALPFKTAKFCNILEEDLGDALIKDGQVEFAYRPFEIVSLKLIS